jgi:hypothetical protein
LPSGVERAIADSLSLEHPDVAWTPPTELPSLADLRAAMGILEAQCAQATRQHVAWCLSKLSMALEPSVKLSDSDLKFRASIWTESCGDLGDTLWSEATMAAIQSCKFMPKPAEFRALVGGKLAARAKRMKRCKAMLDAAGNSKPVAPTGFVAEPRIVRLRAMRDSYRKHGYADRAAKIEVELAGVEGREPEDWIHAAQVEAGASNEDAKSYNLPTPPPSPEMRRALDAALAPHHRAQGNVEYAARLEARAGIEPPLHDDVPEAMEGE